MTINQNNGQNLLHKQVLFTFLIILDNFSAIKQVDLYS